MSIGLYRWTAADVTYDESTHTSTLPDGTNVPHVTFVLGAVGVCTDFGALSDLSPRIGANVHHARERGSAIHADCHAYDDDDLEWTAVDYRVRPYVEAWAYVREDKRLTPVRRERKLFHPLHVYTGIEDGVFRTPTGKHVLIDLKSGDPEHAGAHLQTAAYEAADALTFPDAPPIDERWAVWLRPGRSIPYTITNYTARPDQHQDFPKFLACLTVYHEQPARRAKVR